MSNCLKRFLNRHSFTIDFLSASVVISICLIVLLPKVHESFLEDHQHNNHTHDHEHDIIISQQQQQQLAITIGPMASPMGQIGQDNDDDDGNDEDHHHHHHNHTFPTGEVLICIGFFVFYCLGSNLIKPDEQLRRSNQMVGKSGVVTLVGGAGGGLRQRSSTTICCSSTRCPTSNVQSVSGQNSSANEQTMILADLNNQQQQSDTDCVLLLNRHHTHHTHSRHHEHLPTTSANATTNSNNNNNTNKNKNNNNKRSNYGTSSKQSNMVIAPDLIKSSQIQTIDDYNLNQDSSRTIIVDEIRITATSARNLKDQQDYLKSWPLSVKMLMLSLVWATFLVFFEMNLLGLLKSIKVFRAASTGGLLYIAFFLMFPRRPVGCNSCEEEQGELANRDGEFIQQEQIITRSS